MQPILDLWWVFPAAVVFSTVAISSGVSGALFFSPFFLLVVGLDPAQAVGAGLLTEVFGMGNGLRSYVRQRVVDYATARWLLAGAVPSIAAGALLAHAVPARTLKVVFGAGLLLLAVFMLFVPTPQTSEEMEPTHGSIERHSRGKGTTVISSADGEVYEYPTCWRLPGVLMAVAGGALTGMISAGLPEITTSQLVLRCRMPARVAIATSIFTLAIAAVVGAAIHAFSATPVWRVVAWSIPGVLVGSTIGSRVSKHLPGPLMEKVLGVVFAAVGVLVLVLEFAR
ncbi:MAG: sulfite exporter TauE/SafE family protein [Gemmatimonadota bacterium]